MRSRSARLLLGGDVAERQRNCLRLLFHWRDFGHVRGPRVSDQQKLQFSARILPNHVVWRLGHSSRFAAFLREATRPEIGRRN